MTPPVTLNQLFFDAAPRFAGRPAAFRRKHDGRWENIPFSELRTRVEHLQASLRELGLVPGDRVAILSENRPEWAIADYACLTGRLVDVPIYPSLPAAQVAYIVKDAGARAIFVSTRAHVDTILSVRDELPDLRHVIVFDEVEVPAGVLTLHELETRGASAIGRYPNWESEARAAQPDDLATLIYTSGTTGEPKGVMLTHGNITSNVVGALQALVVSPSDEYLSFLPLCHIFERMVGHFTMLQAGAVVSYASGFDAVSTEMNEVHPTILASVPRLYEKIYGRVVESAIKAGGLKRAIFEWAKATGEKHLDYVLTSRTVPPGLRIGNGIADVLVFSKLRGRTGGKIRFFISGGAPLNPDICRFFCAAGLTILEGYGLTETSPVIAFNRLEALKPGTVGLPLAGVEVRIADDGEVLVRGPNVMKGYYNKPRETLEAIDSEGWFKTGDIGEIDNDGFLRITDRKKDLIKTSGGKYVAPQPIEGMLKTNKFFANAVMLGDQRKFPIMLLVPDFRTLGEWITAEGLPERPVEELVEAPEIQEKLEREARKSLRDLAQFETPKRFLILPHDFTIESGELTPTLKVKRRVVEARYKDKIDALYAGAA